MKSPSFQSKELNWTTWNSLLVRSKKARQSSPPADVQVHHDRDTPTIEKPIPTPGILDIFLSDFNWGDYLSWERSTNASRQSINFLRVPLRLEPFLVMGMLICMDLFFFQLTMLPLKCVSAIWKLVLSILRVSIPRNLISKLEFGKNGDCVRFKRVHAYSLVKGALIGIGIWFISLIEVSRVYHYIRGEAFIKLYVIFNILEIFDRLACSFGADVIDSIYRASRDDLKIPGISQIDVPFFSWVIATTKVAAQYFLGAVYVCAHSLIMFIQLICLNVAINSRSNGLLSLLISNNFVELKGSVFKRFEAENLFQISCADCVERFQLLLFLTLIALQDTSADFSELVFPIFIIFAAEVAVDYTKHAFISKFNRLHPSLYSAFGAILSHDYVASKSRTVTSLDPTHSLGKRMGLATLPLVVVSLRMFWLRVASMDSAVTSVEDLDEFNDTWDVDFPDVSMGTESISLFLRTACFVSILLLLFLSKFFLGLALLKKSAKYLSKQSNESNASKS